MAITVPSLRLAKISLCFTLLAVLNLTMALAEPGLQAKVENKIIGASYKHRHTSERCPEEESAECRFICSMQTFNFAFCSPEDLSLGNDEEPDPYTCHECRKTPKRELSAREILPAYIYPIEHPATFLATCPAYAPKMPIESCPYLCEMPSRPFGIWTEQFGALPDAYHFCAPQVDPTKKYGGGLTYTYNSADKANRTETKPCVKCITANTIAPTPTPSPVGVFGKEIVRYDCGPDQSRRPHECPYICALNSIDVSRGLPAKYARCVKQIDPPHANRDGLWLTIHYPVEGDITTNCTQCEGPPPGSETRSLGDRQVVSFPEGEPDQGPSKKKREDSKPNRVEESHDYSVSISMKFSSPKTTTPAYPKTASTLSTSKSSRQYPPQPSCWVQGGIPKTCSSCPIGEPGCAYLCEILYKPMAKQLWCEPSDISGTWIEGQGSAWCYKCPQS